MTVTIPKEDRVVFPGVELAVYWLALPGDSLPAKKEYDKHIDSVKAEATFRAIDRFLAQKQPVPSTYMSPIRIDRSLKLWEIRAPKRGPVIGRMFAYRGQGWDLYLALCRKKKSQKIPQDWKTTAAGRVRLSMNSGGP